MADQENGTSNANLSENDTKGTAAAKPTSQPADAGKGAGADEPEDADKAEAMEDAQKDAAHEREENRGYQ